MKTEIFHLRFSLSSTKPFLDTANADYRKWSPQCSFFEKVCSSFSSGLTRTEVFEYDDVIRHDSACPVKDAIVFSSVNRLQFL